MEGDKILIIKIHTKNLLYYDSVSETLKTLKSRGAHLGIVSTKFRYRIESILKRDGILELFEVIIGGEDVKNHKPDPEGVHE